MRIVIEVESGMVVKVSFGPQPDWLPDVAIVDYDVWGSGDADDDEDVTRLDNRDGLAHVYEMGDESTVRDDTFVEAVFGYTRREREEVTP